jgi:hypothetical protein
MGGPHWFAQVAQILTVALMATACPDPFSARRPDARRTATKAVPVLGET